MAQECQSCQPDIPASCHCDLELTKEVTNPRKKLIEGASGSGESVTDHGSGAAAGWLCFLDMPLHPSGVQARLGWGLMSPSVLMALAAYPLLAFCAEI